MARTTMPNTAMLRLEHSNSPASSHSLPRRGTNLTTFVIPEGDEASDYVRDNRRSAPVPPPVPCAPSGDPSAAATPDSGSQNVQH